MLSGNKNEFFLKKWSKTIVGQKLKKIKIA